MPFLRRRISFPTNLLSTLAMARKIVPTCFGCRSASNSLLLLLFCAILVGLIVPSHGDTILEKKEKLLKYFRKKKSKGETSSAVLSPDLTFNNPSLSNAEMLSVTTSSSADSASATNGLPLVFYYNFDHTTCGQTDFPPHVLLAMDQVYRFQANAKIYLVSNVKYCSKLNNGTSLSAEKLPSYVRYYEKEKLSTQRTKKFAVHSTEHWPRHQLRTNVWKLCFSKFWFFEKLMSAEGLSELLYISNDNLIYGDLSSVTKDLRSIYSKMAVAPLSDSVISSGLIWFGSANTLIAWNEFVSRLIGSSVGDSFSNGASGGGGKNPKKGRHGKAVPVVEQATLVSMLAFLSYFSLSFFIKWRMLLIVLFCSISLLLKATIEIAEFDHYFVHSFFSGRTTCCFLLGASFGGFLVELYKTSLAMVCRWIALMNEEC